MTKQVFQVTGAGIFPLDMLRYDACWPETQEDVEKINMNYNRGLQPVRSVSLCRIVRNKNLLPTVDRWASFGWTLHPAQIKLYKLPYH